MTRRRAAAIASLAEARELPVGRPDLLLAWLAGPHRGCRWVRWVLVSDSTAMECSRDRKTWHPAPAFAEGLQRDR